ncbi:TPA: hypothetical protein ACN35C_004632 [Vibrio parahaemolyticus]
MTKSKKTKKENNKIVHVPMKEEAKDRLKAVYSQFGVKHLAPFIEGIIQGKPFTFVTCEEKVVKRNAQKIFRRNESQINEFASLFMHNKKRIYVEDDGSAIEQFMDSPLTETVSFLENLDKLNPQFINICIEYINLALALRDGHFTDHKLVELSEDDEWFQWYYNELKELIQMKGGSDTTINIDLELFNCYANEMFSPRPDELQQETAQNLSQIVEFIQSNKDFSQDSIEFLTAILDRDIHDLLTGETVFVKRSNKLTKRSLSKKPTRYQSLIYIAQNLKVQQRGLNEKQLSVINDIDAAMAELNEVIAACHKIKLNCKTSDGKERNITKEEIMKIFKLLIPTIRKTAIACVNAITKYPSEEYINLLSEDYGIDYK